MQVKVYDDINYCGRKIKFLNLEGSIFSVKSIAADWYNGPTEFNLFFVDFNGMFVNMIEDVIEPNKRIKLNTANLKVMSFLSDDTYVLLKELVEVVNFSSRPLVSEDRKKKYSEIMGKIADKISDFRDKDSYAKPDLTIVPMKGGSYFLNFLDKKNVHERTLAIDCKRIPAVKDKSLCFGMNIEESNEFPDNSNVLGVLKGAKSIRIVELCVVSGMTTIGFMLFMHKNNIKADFVEVDTIAMSQQGYDSIMNFAKVLGINVKFVTGGMYYRLGNYYLSRHDELLTLDGKLVIGDVRSFLD